jgi:hypothetical protein
MEQERNRMRVIESTVFARINSGNGVYTYTLKDWPTETQKLINKVKELNEWSADKPQFVEMYDAVGRVHLVNTLYIVEVYIGTY